MYAANQVRSASFKVVQSTGFSSLPKYQRRTLSKYKSTEEIFAIQIFKGHTWCQPECYIVVLFKKLLCLGNSILTTSWYKYIDMEFLIDLCIYFPVHQISGGQGPSKCNLQRTNYQIQFC